MQLDTQLDRQLDTQLRNECDICGRPMKCIKNSYPFLFHKFLHKSNEERKHAIAAGETGSRPVFLQESKRKTIRRKRVNVIKCKNCPRTYRTQHHYNNHLKRCQAQRLIRKAASSICSGVSSVRSARSVICLDWVSKSVRTFICSIYSIFCLINLFYFQTLLNLIMYLFRVYFRVCNIVISLI